MTCTKLIGGAVFRKNALALENEVSGIVLVKKLWCGVSRVADLYAAFDNGNTLAWKLC